MDNSNDNILEAYLFNLNNELEQENTKIKELFLKYKDYKGNILLKVRDEYSLGNELFNSKYLLTGCKNLMYSEVFFIKSAIETANLCEKSTNYINKLIEFHLA